MRPDLVKKVGEYRNIYVDFSDVLLTVPLSIILVTDQIDAQNLVL